MRAGSSKEKNASNMRMPRCATKTVAKVNNTTAGFRYEIDCKRVSDSINVIDLVFLIFNDLFLTVQLS